MFPKQNGFAAVSESFVLNLIISVPLNYYLHYNANLNIFFSSCSKTNRIHFSESSAVSYNPCANPSPRIKMLFVLLLTCTLELISAPKMTTFTSVPPLGCEKVPF